MYDDVHRDRTSMNMSKPTKLAAALWGLAILSLVGCTTVRITDPARTATEQFLLSGAAEKAVAQLTVEPLRGRKAFVDTSYFAASEQAFVVGELRARLLTSGVQLVPKREDAKIVVEVRSGGVGIDRYGSLVGLPTLSLGAIGNAVGGPAVPLEVPELAVMKNVRQHGIASVAIVAYWQDTGEVLTSSGPFVGFALRDDFWFLGFGPRSNGDVSTIDPPKE
jgi:hypothetical protein